MKASTSKAKGSTYVHFLHFLLYTTLLCIEIWQDIVSYSPSPHIKIHRRPYVIPFFPYILLWSIVRRLYRCAVRISILILTFKLLSCTQGLYETWCFFFSNKKYPILHILYFLTEKRVYFIVKKGRFYFKLYAKEYKMLGVSTRVYWRRYFTFTKKNIIKLKLYEVSLVKKLLFYAKHTLIHQHFIYITAQFPDAIFYRFSMRRKSMYKRKILNVN